VVETINELRDHLLSEILTTMEVSGADPKLAVYLLKLEDRITLLADREEELRSRLENLESQSRAMAKSEVLAG
jgi:hypothetical protein